MKMGNSVCPHQDWQPIIVVIKGRGQVIFMIQKEVDRCMMNTYNSQFTRWTRSHEKFSMETQQVSYHTPMD